MYCTWSCACSAERNLSSSQQSQTIMEKSPEQSRVWEKRRRAGKAGILRLSITYGFTVSSKDKYTRTWNQ